MKRRNRIKKNFNPRAPCGARLIGSKRRNTKRNFNPRAPCGARPRYKAKQTRPKTNFNPRAPCGARHERLPFSPLALTQISTHAPLAGRDSDTKSPKTGKKLFQPTRPLRGATYLSRDAACGRYFNPRAPCGARLSVLWSPYSKTISTHAPLAGRDWRPASSGSACRSNFNPRAPCGARHDRFAMIERKKKRFQPTRPLRGATVSAEVSFWIDAFQPTRPLRGATALFLAIWAADCISTHAPLAGRDKTPFERCVYPVLFQPTRPLRGATVRGNTAHGAIVFQPTRPLRGATLLPCSMPFHI